MNPRIVVSLAVLASATLAACSQDGPTVSKPSLNERYVATLAPQAGVTSNPVGSGTATLTIRDTNSLFAEVVLSGIDSVISARFLSGGPTGADLITFYTGPTGGTTCNATPTAAAASCAAFNNSVLRSIDIIRSGTNGTLVASPNSYSQMLAQIRAGTVYFEVRTRENPNGEIGGTLTRTP